MSTKLNKSFCPKITLVAIAASLSLTAFSGATFSAAQAENGNGSTLISDSSASTSNSSDATTGASSSAPLPGGSSSASGSATSDATTAAPDSTQTKSAATGDIPPGVLWTDPKYAVKEVPPPAKAAVPTNSKNEAEKEKKEAAAAAAAASAKTNSYDQKAADSFAESVGMPQYVWTRQDTDTKGKKSSAANATQEMRDYNRALVEKVVANISFPSTASLVTSSDTKYLYLISFTIDRKGKVDHISPVNSYGPYTAVTPADDSEKSAVVNSITAALTKTSPVKLPPTGFAPWYMLLRYDATSGSVAIANLNTI